MKKFYKIVASAALSVLAAGAIAQTPAAGQVVHPTVRPVPMNSFSSRHHAGNKTARTMAGPQNVLLDYVNGDIKNGVGPFTNWLPPMYSNVNYTLADTTFSPLTSAKANVYTCQYSTVAYDSCWDLWTQSFYTPTITASSTLDTIWAEMAYHNTSTTNDTVDFEVVAVDAAGFPTATVYGTVQAIFNQGTLTYNNLDSDQLVQIPCGISIPNTARMGWNFAINFKVHGSKQDTVGLWYYSAYDLCLPNAYAKARTTIGVVDGAASHVNSMVTGNMWFNDVKNHGNAAPIIWPNIPPASASNFPGLCANTGGYYWYPQLGCSPDSAYLYVQDLGMYASISFNNPLGMQQLANNGFEVSQNYPNPFNQNTVITYNLPKASNVVFTVNDITGRELVNTNYSTVAAGQHEISMEANQFTPGVYFYTFNVNGVKVTKRMVITE